MLDAYHIREDLGMDPRQQISEQIILKLKITPVSIIQQVTLFYYSVLAGDFHGAPKKMRRGQL